MLIEENEVPLAALPVEALKSHLRLGTGFTGASLQDEVLESFLRAALAAVEARTGKALIQRTFLWTLPRWRDPRAQVIPLAPVSAILEVTRLDAAGVSEVVDAARYRLVPDAFAPMLEARGPDLPPVPEGGLMQVRMTAGFGPDWDGIPADLAQAVMMLAAHYYDNRDAMGLGPGCMPFGVTSLLQRHRPLRLFNGGAW
ncbi:head-tail connector protein [Pseudooceanicola sp. C21-150M6]|uniref:head-tail connector protein n=1 Tax=Pseudooceanicola sp. C21-150M6 TaxID=3434355 RepID=UPI003D7F898C